MSADGTVEVPDIWRLSASDMISAAGMAGVTGHVAKAWGVNERNKRWRDDIGRQTLEQVTHGAAAWQEATSLSGNAAGMEQGGRGAYGESVVR